MVRDLIEEEDKRNYLIGNLPPGPGVWGDMQFVRRGQDFDVLPLSVNPEPRDTHQMVFPFANRSGTPDFHVKEVQSLQPFLMPWYPIPLEQICPFER